MGLLVRGSLERSYLAVRVILLTALMTLILLQSWDVIVTHAVLHLYVHQLVPGHVDASYPIWILLSLTHFLLALVFGLYPRGLDEGERSENTSLYRALLIAVSIWGFMGCLVCWSGPGELLMDRLTYQALFVVDNLCALSILVAVFVWSRGKRLSLVAEYSLTAIVCIVGWSLLILSVAGASHWVLVACSALAAVGSLRLLGLVRMLGQKSLSELKAPADSGPAGL